MAHFQNSVMPSAARGLTAEDVRVGCTWYVMHQDTDGNIMRYHGPMCAEFAAKMAQTLCDMGHVGKAMNTPERVKKALVR